MISEFRLTTPELPQQISERYTVRRRLASGACTEVFLADDAHRMTEVALKVLRVTGDPISIERFRWEAEVESTLDHPNIISIVESGTGSGCNYIVMEYVAGGTLSSLVHTAWAASHLDPGEVARIGGEIARALEYLHARGYIHQRLTPANVLMDDGRPKLIDFATAESSARDNPVKPVDPASFSFPTVSYLAPEQAMGQRASARTDQYSLGAMLYEMATGRPPFVGGSTAVVVHKHLNEAAIPPTWMNGAIPSSLEGLILRALAKDPAKRYSSAGELATDLDRFRNEFDCSTTQCTATSVVSGGAPNRIGDPESIRPAVSTGAPATRLLASTNTAGAPDWTGKSRSASSVSGTLGTSRPRRRPSAAAAIGLALFAGCIGLYTGRSFGVASASRHATVPNVNGLSAADATAQLRLVGLRVTTRSRPAAANMEGDVLAQAPAWEQQVAKGTTVTITIGRPRMIEVPNVENLMISSARRELGAEGLRVAVRRLVASSPGQSNGLVLRQTPSPMVQAREGSSIVLGVVFVDKVAIPNTTGLSLSEAAVLLQQGGLKVASKFTNLNSETVPSGSVIQSSPASGSKVPRGSSVGLVVSDGPGLRMATPTAAPVIVPSVVGEKVQRAAGQMKAETLRYRVFPEATGDPALNGIVAKTSPRGGRSVASGGVVTMTVWMHMSANSTALPATPGVSVGAT